MNAEPAWRATLGQLQMEMPKAAYETWVAGTEFITYEDGSFIIGVQNAYARDWLESRLASTVKRKLDGLMNRTVAVRFIVWQNPPKSELPTPQSDLLHEENEGDSQQSNNTKNKQKYTFDNFVVGTSNRLAHAASIAVAENPAHSYNPLFLYGGVGLGKTHLLHAIGNSCLKNGLNILYVSSEEFTNDLINAIRTHKTQAFREKYRRTDVLLIDDIQFIAGKESTQEEFFHTFNTLHGQDKQLVISSDRPPKAMITLEERLRSRFEWGLAADIQPPDFETRVAILRSKALRVSSNVADEIIELIARRVQSNIRELEGALTRVAAFSQISAMPLSPQLVESLLADLLPRRANIQIDEVIDLVAREYGLETDRLMGRERTKDVALPRQVAMYLLREEANISLPKIGEALGGRDHTTVMYACDKVADLLETDDRFRRQVVEIRQSIYGQSV